MYLRGSLWRVDGARGSASASTRRRFEDAARRLGVRLRVVVCHEDARIVDIVDGRVVELVLQRVAHGGRHRVLDALAVLADHDADQKDGLDILGVGRAI